MENDLLETIAIAHGFRYDLTRVPSCYPASELGCHLVLRRAHLLLRPPPSRPIPQPAVTLEEGSQTAEGRGAVLGGKSGVSPSCKGRGGTLHERDLC